jgi:hypothetical protein
MKNEKDSNGPPADSQAQSPPQPPVLPPAPLQGALPNDGKGNADEEKNKTNELAREFRIAEKWVIGTNIVLGIIGIVALCIYNGQLRVMRGQLGEIIRQYPELQKSADAAKKSADTAEHSFQVERRRAEDMEEAILNWNGGGMAAFDNFYRISIGNSGKVTARDIEAHLEISLNAVPSNKKIRVLGNRDISTPELAREKSLDQKLELPLSSRDWENIADTRQVIVASWRIRYENGFERIISDTSCQVWLYYRTPGDKLNPIQGRGTDCGRLPELLAGIPKPQKP